MKKPALLTSILLIAGALLPAQGTYQPYGTACRGTGSTTCASSNPATITDAGNVQNPYLFALRVSADRNQRVVTGFDLFTRTTGTSKLVIGTQVYTGNNTGKPQGTPVATGRMILGTTAGWYRRTFSTPLVVKANEEIFLSYTSVANQMYFPIASSGTKTAHFARPVIDPNWGSIHLNQPWAWKLNCGGGAAPRLSHTGLPTINSSMSVDLSEARANAVGIFVLGVCDSSWGALALPFTLAPLNAPNCNIYASGESQFFITTSNTGAFRFPLSIPNDPTLNGLDFFNQYVVDDPTANGFGAVFSNGGKATIG